MKPSVFINPVLTIADTSPEQNHRKSLSLRSDSSADERGLTGLISTTHVSNAADHTTLSNNRRIGTDLPTDRSPGAREIQPKDSEDSIDGRIGQTAFLLGDTGESDPYLLRHSSLAASDGNGASKIHYRQINFESDPLFDSEERDDGKHLVFMFADHSLHEKYEPRINDDIFRRAETELENMCPEEVGIRLVNLFFKYVYPYFPILSRSQMMASDPSTYLKSLPLSLKAVLYATGLPFVIYDDVLATMLDLNMRSAQSLYRICWLAIAQETHTPHLSTLQSCLLLLQRVNDDRYVMDSPFRWSLLAWAISLAQGLGLSTDCSHWQGVPAWEKRLRRRLWWAVYVVDKWSFSSAGISSHIKTEDFDVSPLSSADFISTPESHNEDPYTGTLHERSHFYHLVELSMILSDVIDAYFTIRASKKTRNNFALAIELARPFRSRLHEWKETYDLFVNSPQVLQQQLRLDGNASLGLLYPVATMILFRALLRPLESSKTSLEDRIILEGKDAVRAGAKACCVEVVQYLEQVKRGVWDAFWHSCTLISPSVRFTQLIQVQGLVPALRLPPHS